MLNRGLESCLKEMWNPSCRRGMQKQSSLHCRRDQARVATNRDTVPVFGGQSKRLSRLGLRKITGR